MIRGGPILDLGPIKIDAGTMHRLFLLRHAKSDWSVAGQPDFERPLNARGVAAARLMGDYMARHDLVPDGVICSPSRRTLQSRERLCARTDP